MVYKERTMNQELQFLSYLSKRMRLSENEVQYHFTQKKGFEGEKKFDSLTEELTCECIVLNDLLLKTNKTHFQIDTMILLSDTIYVFEVKNYEGDYYYESDRLYKNNKSEISNPLNQLTRSISLLRQLLHLLGFNFLIDASVVFINSEFTLYQSPPNKPFIFPSQINRYLRKLSAVPSKVTERQKNLADKLISLHIKESPFMQLPSYDFEQLRKGITCLACNSFSISIIGKQCSCLDCGHKEIIENAVIRSVEEFRFLFPNEKITTNIIHEWCRIVPSKKRIKRILDKTFTIVSVNRWTYYE